MTTTQPINMSSERKFVFSRDMKFLKNPLTILFAIGIGVYVGLNHDGLSKALEPFGYIYGSLLQMSVIPILLASIISSIGRISEAQALKQVIVKYFAVSLLASLLVALFGGGGQMLAEKMGLTLSPENRSNLDVFLGDTIKEDLEVSISEDFVETSQTDFGSFLLDSIPDNIFKSLVSGATIELVLFSLVVGVSLNFLKQETKKPLIELSLSVFLAFQKFIDTLIYFLPFGVICLLASQLALMGPDLIASMLNFIVTFYVMALLLASFCFVFILIKTKKSPLKTLSIVLQPILIAFTTRSSFAAIPASVSSMEKLRYDRIVVNLAIPLGISLGRYGNIFFFASASVFTFFVYESSLATISPNAFTIIIFGSIIAGLATTGATGFATLGFISIILTPLGLPVEAIVLILMAIDVLIDPIRSMLITLVNLTVTSWVSPMYEGNRKSGDE